MALPSLPGLAGWCGWRAGLLLVWSVLAAGGASAQQGAPPNAEAQTVARNWFLRMQAAAAKANFEGSLVVSVGGVVSSSRVTHYAVGGQVYEMLEAMDGRAHRVVRHNDVVHMLWPQTQTVVIEKRATLAAWSTTPQAVDVAALENYDMRMDGTARVAGRDAVVLWSQPKDRLRYAQRFWADRETGLMLRADVLALQPSTAPPAQLQQSQQQPRLQPQQPAQDQPRATWQVLESTAFSALELGVPARPQWVLQALQVPSAYREVRPQQQVTTLEAQGFSLMRPVPGYRLAASVLRGIENAGRRDPVLHAVFTDGLALVSLFVETYDDKLHRAEAHNQQGATASLSQRRGEQWFTVVAAAPLSTLRLFAAALDKRSP